MDGIFFLFEHHLMLSMIDGKTVNAIAEITSQQRCYLCGLTSKGFNMISKCLLAKVNNKKLLELGISPLHAII